MTTDTDKFFYDSPDWDGGNRYWRNLNENKTGRYTLYDGNIIGPWFAQVGEGQCGLHEDFAGGFIQVGSYPPYGDASDWTFTNNTCLNMPSTSMGTAYPFSGYIVYPYPIKNFLIQNDLFLNNNAYAQTAINQPFDAYVKVVNDQTSVQCPQGIMSGWYPQENVVMDHITVSGQGGCQSFFNYLNMDFPSMAITNSILNFVNDPGAFANYNTGIAYNLNGYSSGTCITSYTPKGVWPCINNFTWAGNLVLPTWTNSLPGSQVDFTTSQITGNVAPNFTGYPTNFPTANTLAGRQGLPTASGGNPTSIGWLNVSSGNFRLAATSPYISGNTHSLISPTTDGLSVGVDMDQLDQHQGKVSNVRVISLSSTTAQIGLYAPDSFACGVDWGTSPFYIGSGTWTRVNGAAGSSDPRVQNVSIGGLPAHGLIYYRVNCAVQQPTGTIQLP